MIIYKDAFNGDEMCSDCYPMTEEGNGVMFRVESKTITKGPISVDIGANASAEGDDGDGVDDAAETVNNVVDAFRLQSMPFPNKKSYMGYLKDFLKRTKAHLEATKPERVAGFQAESQAFIKDKILPNFDDFSFYSGESMDPEAGMMMMFYEGENPNPFFYFFKDACVEEKC
eukprot:CAMPEP_0114553880 /NCGR_PEP_ID=MMETSP0114-20121206/7904_1 /TAXON_ID=31324 /ORGANISM="Goniomonas sp, Strain m" /LENGTH=171 /DNA_ID=CAMNT_0001738873 /DNA_START=60 /DNA_END=575 /DNA_ORIENTATION=+